jgi:hypothetical protein
VKDGRTAAQPYRVRVGNVWYWVDPTVPRDDIEPGDTVVIYPAAGDATLAILQCPFKLGDTRSAQFSTLEGDGFSLPAGDIAALHLAAVDDVQT